MQRHSSISNMFITLWLVVWLVITHTVTHAGDLEFYLNAGRLRGDFYYPYHILPLMTALGWLPFEASLVLIQISIIGGLWLWGRAVQRPVAPAMLSFPFVFLLISGQISGLMFAGAGLCWMGCRDSRWGVASIGVPLLLIKPQFGVPLLLVTLFHFRPNTFAVWFRLLAPYLLLNLLSLALYGFWPLALAHTLLVDPPHANASVWQVLGPGVVMLWFLCLPEYVPIERLQAALGCSAIAMPYMPVYDTVVVYAFLPWWAPVATWLILPAYVAVGRPAFLLLMLFPVGLFGWQVARMISRSYRDGEVRYVPADDAV